MAPPPNGATKRTTRGKVVRSARLGHDGNVDSLAIGRVQGDLYWSVNGIRLGSQMGDRIIEEYEPLRSGWTLGPVLEYLDQLSSPRAGEFPSGHAALLVCQECGDLECGAITAAVDFDETTVTWSDFRWQQPSGWAGVGHADPPITFTFDRPEYVRTLRSLREQIALTATLEPASGMLWWRRPARSYVRL